MTVTSGRDARVGILGGTFNPPHIAHLVCAAQARTQLALGRIVLMPAGRAPHKESSEDPGAEHRLAMCELAARGRAWLSVSSLETRREGPSYTVDTLGEIHANQPGDELTFIVGGDMAWSLPTWREPETILELATLAVAERAGIRREAIISQLRSLRGAQQIAFIEMPRLDVSSSLVREQVRAGRPIDYLVPDAVAGYIEQRRLYV